MLDVSSLISVSDLVALLVSERPTLLDVRWQLGGPPGEEEFMRGHVPGAAYVDLETALADPPGDRGRHPLPAVDRFGEAMRRCGVSVDRPVVVYDGGSSSAAARAWWLLRYFGHRDVRVLDGGYAEWARRGQPVEDGPGVSPDPGELLPDPGHMPVLDADEVLRVAREGVLVDARAPERYRGEREPVDPVAGHIPGSVNVPATANLVSRGSEAPRFRPPDALEAVYRRAGLRAGAQVGAYCGSGVTAAQTVLALEHLAEVDRARGWRPAALYPGSWSEWVTDPRRPVALGDEQAD